MCYIVFIPRIQRPLRPASVFSMMMMMMMMTKYISWSHCNAIDKALTIQITINKNCHCLDPSLLLYAHR